MRQLPARCVSIAFFVFALLTLRAHAQCTVSLTAGQPDANSLVAVHVEASANGCLMRQLLGVSLKLDDIAVPYQGTCANVESCSFDTTLSMYCTTPGVQHTIKATCDVAGTGCDGPPVTSSFTTPTPFKPQLDISYSANKLLRSWTFLDGTHQGLKVYIDGTDFRDYTSIPAVGSDAVDLPSFTCTGDHTISGYALACFAQVDQPDSPWLTRKDLLVPDPGNPTVKLDITPDVINPSAFNALIDYSFPATGTRTVKLLQLAKPSDHDGIQIAVYNPSDLSGTLGPIALPAVTGDALYRAEAISGACSPAREADDDGGFKNCCSMQGAPNTVGTPVSLVTGNMRYADTDPLPVSILSLTRTYDSGNSTRGVFGIGWTSYLDAAFALDGTGAAQAVVVNTEANDRYVFMLKGAGYAQLWPKDNPTPATLTGSPSSGFALRDSGSDMVRSFNVAGRLTTITSLRQQRSLTISYDTNGHPTRADDSWGVASLVFTTDSNGLITGIVVDGHPELAWTYQYSSNLLTSVAAPDSHAWRQYEYTSALLSTIRDPLGNVIESHAYDSSGRAISSSQSTNDIQTIDHLAGRVSGELLTRVTYASGKVSDYYSRSAGGSMLTVDVFGGCSSCSAENGTYVYDLGGHVVRQQDPRGYVTDFTFSGGVLSSMRGPLKPAACDPQTDTNHCRMTAEDLAAATPDATSLTKTTTYVYGNTSWPDLPTLMTVTSVANPSSAKTEAIVYDTATGQPLSRAEIGWIDATHQETHTTTTALYNGTEGAAFAPGLAFQSSWLTLPQPAGLRKSVDGPRTDVSDLTTFVYYPVDSSVPSTWRGRLAGIRNALGQITTYENYDVFGNALRVVDPNFQVVYTTYDALGRLLTTTQAAVIGCDTSLDPTCSADITFTRGYSAGGGPLSIDTKPRGGVTSYTYDARGRVASITRTVSSTLSERIEYDYDAATGQKSAERVLDNSSGSFVVKKSVAYSYDANGRLIQVLYPDAAKVLYTYDVAGALASVQDENHASANTSYKYNETGAVREVDQTLGTGQIATSYGYDLQGNLTRVTDPNGNVTTYTYDDFGRMTGQTSPVTGTTTYAYDPAGNLLTTVDANAATTTRTYDTLSRIASAASSRSGSATETVTWTYDDPAAAGYGIGRMTGGTDPTGSTTLRYDHRGLLRLQQQTVGGATYSTSLAYDADGDRSSLTYPSGRVVSYTFDLAGRPLSATSGATTYASTATYLPFGPLTSFNFGNGAKRAMTFDSRYRITENKLFNPPNTIARYTYSYDAGENITAIQDLVDATYTRNFGYDDFNRLITANTGASLWGTGSYAYDAMGNLTSRSLGTPPVDTGQPLSTPGRPFHASTTVTGQVDRLAFTFAGTTPKISVVTANGLDHTVSYDAAGNETGYLANRTYSARNLMNAVADTSGEGPAHQITYGYDWRGVRVSRTETPTDAGSASRYFFYSPELQFLESTVDDSNNVWGQSAHHIASAPLVANRDIIWFNGAPVAEIGPPRTPDNTPLSTHRTLVTAMEATNTFWTFTDHLGTPLIQMDNTTTIVWRAEHEPYGNVWKMRAGARTDQPLRFPGQELAMTWEGGEENYNVFRWYRAGWGRYTQSDPLGLAAGINDFSYAIDDPLHYIDPTGREALPIPPMGPPAQICPFPVSPKPFMPGAGWIGGAIVIAIDFMFNPGIADAPTLEKMQDKLNKQCGKCKKQPDCPPCEPPVGALGYRWDKVPPSKPHWPWDGDHIRYYFRSQSPAPACKCFWSDTDVVLPPPPSPVAVPLPNSPVWP
jgi:RHS repeat-associated protein